MEIDKETSVFISIAERPGNFGSQVHNKGFEAIGFSGIYIPFKVNENGLPGAIQGIRSLGIRGCSVSMPYKKSVISLLDSIDAKAQKIGAVNTIVNNNGKLTGYNTDCYGAMRAISESYDPIGKKILLIGAGGVSRAIIVALQELGVKNICLTNRDEDKASSLIDEFKINFCKYKLRNNYIADILINATSVGMSPNENEMVIDPLVIDHYNAVMDVIVYPSETELLKRAKSLGKVIIPGYKMSLYQAAEQFRLYTHHDAPMDVMQESVNKFLLQH